MYFLLFRPSHLQKGYIFPDVSAEQERTGIISNDNVVRIAASFDMGWPTKGSGRSYDSLSGTGELIGYFTKKILSVVVLNRKCRMCDRGHCKKTHDCRLNHEGSAKSMESAVAVKLIKDNMILNECKVEVAIFISDNDSSAIAAVRNAVYYEIVKVDDTNHTSKGVISTLYKMKPKFKELNNTVIQYLGKCFNY